MPDLIKIRERIFIVVDLVHLHSRNCIRFRMYPTSLIVVHKLNEVSKLLCNISKCVLQMKEKLWSTVWMVNFHVPVQ